LSSSSTDRVGGQGPPPTTGTLVDVVMPQMGVSVAEGTVAEWRKQPGDWVEADETICVISTDKIDSDVPAPATGRLTEIEIDEGETVPVGTVLARIDSAGKPGEPHAAEDLGPPEAGSEAAAAAKVSMEPEASVEPEASGGRRQASGNGDRSKRYSPVVTRMAAEHGVDLDAIEGTGRGGRVTKKDVLAFLEQQPAEEPPMHIESPYKPEPEPEPQRPTPTAQRPVDGLSRMRRTIGEHMKRSLETAAHCTTIVECDMSAVERRRAAIGTTALPIVARCVVEALREFPDLNAWLEDDTFTRHDGVHLGIAVSLGDDGLIVPVVRDAQNLSDEGLGRRIRDLARRARDRELQPDDVRGGTFTITNPGQYGALAATPIINQPQVAILDLEAVVKRPVVITDADGNDSIAIRPMTMLCMSWDHRAIDGAYAARFLTALRRRIEAV
jgi:pyruvate/2-oxoglutarate dehydrogenase complex dihydrolipoamide acyltransferase (E2) component